MIISIILSIISILLISQNSLYLGNKLGLIDKPSKKNTYKSGFIVRWSNNIFGFNNFFINKL